MNKHIKIWSFADVDRGGKVRWTANELGYEIEEERVKLVQLPIDQFDTLPQIIDEFAEEVDEVGLNPFKGM